MNDETAARDRIRAAVVPTRADRPTQRRGRAVCAGVLAVIACFALPATSAIAACEPADAALAGAYAGIEAKAAPSLQLNQDGSFRMRGVPMPGMDVAGCWQRSEQTVVLVERAPDSENGLRRKLPPPLTEADLNEVRGDGIGTLQQAVDAGLLPPGAWWAHRQRRGGETVRVKVYDPRYGLAVGDAKAMLRLSDGRVVEQSAAQGADGQFEFEALPADAAVKAIGVRFPEQPDTSRWLTVDDPTKLLYLIEFDAQATGAAEGGVMTLTVQADRSLISDFPDATHFKRAP
ncbi:hypothetical protein GLA29479_4286 [Lysobacter antibioticus]|uniref:hypothetical protein n=1 Tax=Lysobacter antibioticus TaxID=84531 RepID=UPI000716EEE4|nr:hypothetical protein [Lysobacter antibioticus]ALN65123.1 hypothetical protein GLA29479_4286 [Lysobacter antibioticus]